jgi:small subunit ribosomal protein S3
MLGKDGDKDKMEVLNSEISKLTGGKKVRIDVIAVANPDLDARLVARKICEQLEARQSFRIAQKKTIQQTMRSGAKGIKTLAKGRLGGAEIARSEGYSRGVVPLHTLRSDIDYACEEAHTTYGKLGVKVWICRGEVLPGQMVKEPEAPARAPRGDRRNNRRGGRNDRRPARRNAEAAAPAAPAAAPAEGGNE